MAMLDVDDLMLCVSGLGSKQLIDGESVYVIGDECDACLGDLQRYLRRDSPKDMAAHKQLGAWALAKEHLLPMLLAQVRDERLVFNLLKLLVKLTMPVGPEHADPDLQAAIDAHKAAFAGCARAVCAIKRMLEAPLARARRGGEEDEADNDLIELVLVLFRNLLHAPPPDATPPGARDGRALAARAAAEGRARLLAVLEATEVLEVVLDIGELLSGSTVSRGWNLTLLEVVYCLTAFAEPDAVVAAAASADDEPPAAERGGARAGAGAAAPSAVRQMLARLKAAEVQAALGSTVRHSNFGGSYEARSDFGARAVVARVTAAGEAAPSEALKRRRGLVKHQPLLEPAASRPALGCGRARALLAFGIQMLGEPLRALLVTVAKDLSDAHFGSTAGSAGKVLAADYVYFAAVAAWFCDLHRLLETRRLRRAARPAAAAAAAARRAPRPAGAAADGSEGEGGCFQVGAVAEACRLSCWQMGLRLARAHLEGKEWLKLAVVVGYLRALILILDAMATRGDAEARRVAGALFQSVFHEGELLPLLSQLIRAYEPFAMGAAYLRDVIELTHVTLRHLERYGNQHGGLVLRRRAARRKKRTAGAAAAAAARAGKARAAADAAALAAADAAGTDGADAAADAAWAAARAADDADEAAAAAAAAGGGGGGEAADEDEDEDGLERVVLEEVALDFERALLELTSNGVLWKYCVALSKWRENPPALNHMVARFLLRAIKQCGLEPALWQARVLAIAHDVLADDASARAEHADVRGLAERLAAGFLAAAVKSPVLLVEALFWKQQRECEELRSGYAAAHQRVADRRAADARAAERAVFGADADADAADWGERGRGRGGGGGGEAAAAAAAEEEASDEEESAADSDADYDDAAAARRKRARADAAAAAAAADGAADGAADAKSRRARKEAKAKAEWSAADDEVLRDNFELYADWGDDAYSELASLFLNKSERDVRHRVKKLRLHRQAAADAARRDPRDEPLTVAGAESTDDEDGDVLRRGAPRRFDDDAAGGADADSGAGDGDGGRPADDDDDGAAAEAFAQLTDEEAEDVHAEHAAELSTAKLDRRKPTQTADADTAAAIAAAARAPPVEATARAAKRRRAIVADDDDDDEDEAETLRPRPTHPDDVEHLAPKQQQQLHRSPAAADADGARTRTMRTPAALAPVASDDDDDDDDDAMMDALLMQAARGAVTA